VLVTFASKMGSTQEIAEFVGHELEDFGLQVTVAPCADNVSPQGFDGVIIGSAIYTRRWEKAATKYLKRHAARLDRHRTWLFHSGPCGEGARRAGPGTEGRRRVIGPLGLSAPVTFGGRLDLDLQSAQSAGGWAPRDPSPATFGTGTESVPGPPRLPASSILPAPASGNETTRCVNPLVGRDFSPNSLGPDASFAQLL
jgi:menaquinone-dependent protoporphyrinogen oxidase